MNAALRGSGHKISGKREKFLKGELENEVSKPWSKQYMILSLVKDFTHYNSSRDHPQQINRGR